MLVCAGAYVLRLDTALYAVPAMLGAMSVVVASRRLAPFEPDKKRLALYELGGYVLSGLAFALAYSSPYGSSALFSTNIVVVALLGVVLYSAALWKDRHPAFLYLALGAYLSVRVGLWYFIAERFHAFEGRIALALGYAGQLPRPFRAIVAVIVSLVLASACDLVCPRLERPAAGPALPLPGAAAFAGGLRVEHVRADRCLHLPVGLRDSLPRRGVGLCRSADDLSGRGRVVRRVLFRLDARTGYHDLGPGADRGRDRLRVLGRRCVARAIEGCRGLQANVGSFVSGSAGPGAGRRDSGGDGQEHRNGDGQHHVWIAGGTCATRQTTSSQGRSGPTSRS